MNYINALPDFLAMQRMSFCWFITQGLTEELSLFSRIQYFNQNTELITFAEEYSLIKPSYSLLIARKYSGNYRAQLVIPTEVRNKIINSVCYNKQFPIITLPLMTTDATFIINGCERVIVSQIIRSPGIYFEKNKNQKIRNQFKRKLSTDINKLRSFIPSGEPFISELDLFFPTVVEFSTPSTGRLNRIAHWDSNFIYYYSLKYLKQTQKGSSFYFLRCFKFYKIISQTKNKQTKVKLIKLFVKWLKLKNNYRNFTNEIPSEKIIFLIKYFNFLLKLTIKYSILSSNWLKDGSTFNHTSFDWFENFITRNKISLVDEYLNFSREQILNLYLTYDNTIKNAHTFAYIQFNSELFLITRESKNWLVELSNFSFLKKQINEIAPKLNEIKELTKLEILRPTINFSISLKDQLKYIFVDRSEYFKRRHKYLKSKTQYLLYNKDHEIKLTSNRKYDEKDLYTATLIPEYGSWIRFGFQKNTKIKEL